MRSFTTLAFLLGTSSARTQQLHATFSNTRCSSPRGQIPPVVFMPSAGLVLNTSLLSGVRHIKSDTSTQPIINPFVDRIAISLGRTRMCIESDLLDEYWHSVKGTPDFPRLSLIIQGLGHRQYLPSVKGEAIFVSAVLTLLTLVSWRSLKNRPQREATSR